MVTDYENEEDPKYSNINRKFKCQASEMPACWVREHNTRKIRTKRQMTQEQKSKKKQNINDARTSGRLPDGKHLVLRKDRYLLRGRSNTKEREGDTGESL